ncbi:MFS transporter [Anoxybacteroides rupiense]|uniref:MFS transporter n=1 Tax=Anoxybacteroides rupiense TaxID=311460 RepID=UPI002468061B|nr:MFS transporter [Anoxybacillus rupiensis]
MGYLSYFLFIILSNSRFSRSILLIFMINNKITLFQFGLIQLSYYSIRFLSEFPSGVLADYIKRKYSMAIGSLLASLSGILLYSTNFLDISGYFWVFLILFSLDAMASSFLSGSDQAMLYDYLKRKGLESKYPKFLGWREAIAAISLGTTTIIGGFLASKSINLPFLWQGILFLLATLVILFFPENKSVTIKERVSRTTPLKIASEGLNVIKRIPTIQFLVLFMTTLAASTNTVTIFIQGYFNELNISTNSIGIIYGICTVLSALAAINSYHLTKLTLKTILIITTSMFFVGIICLLTEYIPLVIFGFFLIYLKLDFLEPSVYFFLNKYVKEEVRATVLSFFGTALNFVTLIMYPLYGIVGEQSGYKGMIFGMSILSIPLFIYLFIFYKKYKVGDSKTSISV